VPAVQISPSKHSIGKVALLEPHSAMHDAPLLSVALCAQALGHSPLEGSTVARSVVLLLLLLVPLLVPLAPHV
jgi:hypothetical protein